MIIVIVWISFNVSIMHMCIYIYEELGRSTTISVIMGWVGAYDTRTLCCQNWLDVVIVWDCHGPSHVRLVLWNI
jgi:hypothetical protein